MLKKTTKTAAVLLLLTAIPHQSFAQIQDQLPQNPAASPQSSHKKPSQTEQDLSQDAPQFSILRNELLKHNENPETEIKHDFTPWESMDFTYSDNTTEENSKILENFKTLNTKKFPNTNSNGLLYKAYTEKNGSYIIYIPLTPECAKRLPIHNIDSWKCQASIRIQGWSQKNTYSSQPRWFHNINSCFTYNGEAQSGSKQDPTYNSTYTRYDKNEHIIEIRTVIGGKLQTTCNTTFTIPTERDNPIDSQEITTIGQ